MNIYTYWYFIFYSLYEKFSKDKHFDVFATGFFSLFVGLFVVGILGMVIKLINYEFLVIGAKNTAFVCMFVGIINFIYFNKKRQREMYNEFNEIRNWKKDAFAIFMTVLSIVLFVLAVRLNIMKV